MTHPVKISRALYHSIMDQVAQIELPEDFFIDETLDAVEEHYTKRGEFMIDRAKTTLYTMSDMVIPTVISWNDLVTLAAEQFALAQKLTRSCTHLFVRGVGDEDQINAAQNMKELAIDIESFYAIADSYKNIGVDEVESDDLIDLMQQIRKGQARVHEVESTYRVRFSAVRDMRLFNPEFSHNLSGINGNA